jgi:hypothetical protein
MMETQWSCDQHMTDRGVRPGKPLCAHAELGLFTYFALQECIAPYRDA